MHVRLLVVDDEKGITDSLSRYFRMLGYDVSTCNDPIEAYDMICEENYMVIVSDISMPGISGIELLKKIKEFNGMIQVIMMTGVVTIENVLACFLNGANECFLKPLDNLEDVKASVDEAITRLTRWENLVKTMVSRKK